MMIPVTTERLEVFRVLTKPATVAKIQKALNLPASTIEHRLAGLMKQGLIYKCGKLAHKIGRPFALYQAHDVEVVEWIRPRQKPKAPPKPKPVHVPSVGIRQSALNNRSQLEQIWSRA